MLRMKDFSFQENEKLRKLDSLNREFNLQSARDLSFYSRQTHFPFECEESELFINFKIGKDSCLSDPCLLYIPLKQEDMSYELEFFKYKGGNAILNEVLVLKFFKFDHRKGFQLKYLSYRLEVLFFFKRKRVFWKF